MRCKQNLSTGWAYAAETLPRSDIWGCPCGPVTVIIMSTDTGGGGRGPVLCRPFQEQDRAAVLALWEACDLLRPWNDPDRDIDRKLAHDPEGLIVLGGPAEVLGVVMAGYDGHRGWINYLAVHPDRRSEGHGRVLMAAAETYLGAQGCPKINLQIRTTNQDVRAFYGRLGYSADDAISMGKRLVADD